MTASLKIAVYDICMVTYFTRNTVISWQALTRKTIFPVYTRATVRAPGCGALVNICLGIEEHVCECNAWFHI